MSMGRYTRGVKILVDIFKALAEESRLRILALILQGDMCVCEIEESLNMTQSNASRHLSALKRCGILDSYKKAQWAYYRINPSFITKNPYLYDYLNQELRQMPCYNSDCERWGKCKVQDLCNCKEKV